MLLTVMPHVATLSGGCLLWGHYGSLIDPMHGRGAARRSAQRLVLYGASSWIGSAWGCQLWGTSLIDHHARAGCCEQLPPPRTVPLGTSLRDSSEACLLWEGGTSLVNLLFSYPALWGAASSSHCLEVRCVGSGTAGTVNRYRWLGDGCVPRQEGPTRGRGRRNPQS